MEDIASTKADWGTPQTASFSRTESQQPSASPPEPSSTGSAQNQPFGQHYYSSSPGSDMDFILYGPADGEEYADGQAPREQIPGQQDRPTQNSDPQQLQPLEPLSSYPDPIQSPFVQNVHTATLSHHHGNGSPLPPLQTPQMMGHQHVDDPNSIQLWSHPPPWSSVLAGANVDLQASTKTSYPTDRSYPDKMQGELEELGKNPDNGSDEDEGKPKRKRLRKSKKRNHHRSGSRSGERDKRDRGGGGGNGHGVRAS